MKNKNHVTTEGEPFGAKRRVSEARLRIGSPRAEESPLDLPLAESTSASAELVGRLTSEIANIAMLMGPSLGALDELAQNESSFIEHAQVLRQISARLSRYVADVNTISGHPFDLGPVAPLPILEQFIEQHIVRLSPGIRFVSRLSLDLFEVALGAAELRAICEHLTDNAFRATRRRGSVRLEVDNVTLDARSSYALLEGDYLRIRVSDDGIGMSETTLMRAREPFFSAWGEARHWSGLGLTQTEAICRQGLGLLDLRSELGRGTVATVLLRRAARRESALNVGRYGHAPRPIPVNASFLLVDDELQVLSLLHRGLTQHGCKVHLAQDAYTAVELIREGVPCDYAVIDLRLSRGSGLELARELVTLRPGISLVLTSGFQGAEGSIREAKAIECFTYLSKPFDAEQLLSLLVVEDRSSKKG